MRTRGFWAIGAIVAAGVFGLSACQTAADKPSPATQRSGTTTNQGKEIEIDLGGDVDPGKIHDVTAFIEAQGGVEQAKVRVEKHAPEGPASVSIEVWGPGVAGLKLEPALRQQFAYLKDATIRELDLVGGAGAGPSLDVDIEGDDPAVAKQKIIEQMRADGVEGDITVDVNDEGGERRVEVRVEQKK